MRTSEADTDMIAETFGTSSSYAVGDYVVYNSNLYRCKSAVSDTGSWDPDDWVQVALADDVSDLRNTTNNNLEKTNNVVFAGDDAFYPTWKIGAINDSTHLPNPDINFRAMTPKIRCYGDRIITSGVPSGVKLKAYFYAKDGTYLSDTNWNGSATIGTAGHPYVVIVARYDPESSSITMNISDLATIKIQNYAYVLKQIDEIKSTATARKNEVDNQLFLMNSVNLFKKIKTETKNNITYTSTGNGYIKLNGSYTSDVNFDISELSDLEIDTGREYWLSYSSENDSISYLTIYFNTGSGLYLAYDHLFGTNKIKIPENVTAMLLRVYAKANVVFTNTEYKLTLSEAKSNYDLEAKNAEFRFLLAFGIGDCTIIKFSNGTVLVVDFGLAEQQHTLHRSWKRAVTELGITHIDYGIISHYHIDHVGLLIDTDTTDADYVDISQYIDSSTTFFLPNEHAYTTAELSALSWIDEMEPSDHIVQNYNNVMSKLSTAGCKIIYPEENSTYSIGGCQVQFWNADQSWIMNKFEAHETFDYNEASMCNYITIGSNRVLFSGDIGTLSMDKYKFTVLASQIFKVNHHSVGYNVVPIFLNSLMPQLDIAMLGHNSAVDRLGSNPNQAWCEANFVPNVVTGINEKNLSLYVSEDGWKWNTSCRRLICSDEGLTT